MDINRDDVKQIVDSPTDYSQEAPISNNEAEIGKVSWPKNPTSPVTSNYEKKILVFDSHQENEQRKVLYSPY